MLRNGAVPEYRFRLVNVFTVDADPLSGNPLCVFEDAQGMDDVRMQALARQMNLSESTFVLPAEAPGASARVRIFTPSFEMPFAGHPTLGTAHVVRELTGAADRVLLEMKAGVIPVTADGSRFTLSAATPPATRPAPAKAEIASMLNLDERAVLDTPLWVNTGSEQLVVPLASPADVHRARADAERLARLGSSPGRGGSLVYVWAHESEHEVVARFFFLSNGSVVEDPATGSACANLGGYHLAIGAQLPLRLCIRQGHAVGRPSRLHLVVDEARAIFVSGDVVQLGRGTISLP